MKPTRGRLHFALNRIRLYVSRQSMYCKSGKSRRNFGGSSSNVKDTKLRHEMRQNDKRHGLVMNFVILLPHEML